MTAIGTAIAVISKPKLNKEYKRVLLASNSDYLELDNIVIQEDDSVFEMNVSWPSIASSFTFCGSGSATDNMSYIASNSINITINSVAFNALGSGLFVSGINNIRIIRIGNQNYLSVNGSPNEIMVGSMSPWILKNFSRRTTTFTDQTVHNFEINGKKINLNEGNGDVFSSEDGTITGKCETIHLNGLNYINIDMIKPE